MTKILVVDDDDLIRAVIVKTLQEAGHETEESADGANAIAKLSVNKYDYVITDIVMPHENGVSVAAYVKNNNISTPVLVISSHATGDDNMLDFANYYADDVLPKPFTKLQLINAVNGLTSGTDIEMALQNL